MVNDLPNETLSQKYFLSNDITVLTNVLYGGYINLELVNPTLCRSTPFSLEKDRNPNFPCALPIPLLFTPPNGRLV